MKVRDECYWMEGRGLEVRGFGLVWIRAGGISIEKFCFDLKVLNCQGNLCIDVVIIFVITFIPVQ